MTYQKRLLATMVPAAIVLVAVTNFCIIRILQRPGVPAVDVVQAVWPIALPSSIAVILVMSTLYHTLQEVVAELDNRRLEALDLAQRDALTGLANRRLIEDQIELAVARYRRKGERFSVLMIDLDGFKRVNDLLGHQTGDTLIKEAAGRLTKMVRETDMVARFGGDEFLILQTNVARPADIRRLCARIVQQMRKPYVNEERETTLPASIGAVVASDSMHAAADYVRAADTALYAAKDSGRNCYRFFSEELDAELRRRDRLETALRSALRTGEGLAVHFQPQLDSAGTVVGAEALFRWTDPDLGEIAALEAIGVAEECHLIDTLGDFVLLEAARLARRHPALSVAVNLSPVQLARAAMVGDRFQKILDEQGVRPQQIELELTEKHFATDRFDCEGQLDRLRELGFRLALDDFGTGYSSLSHLRRFKVDRLKLDDSFVKEADVVESVALVRATVSLAHSLGMEVVAEGVESEIQERVALEAGCDALQGNRYGSAMTAAEFTRQLDDRARHAA